MYTFDKFKSITKEETKQMLDSFKYHECYKVNLVISDKNLYIQAIDNQNFNHFLRELSDEDNDVLRDSQKITLVWFELVLCGQYILYCEMEDGENDYLLRGYADSELDVVISQIPYKEELLILNNIDYYGDIDPYT